MTEFTHMLQRPGMSRRAFVAASAVAAASLALAGCAGSQDPAPANDPMDGDGTDQPLEPITFCLDYTPNTNHIGVYIAQHEGYYTEEGLEVTIVQPADDTAEALLGTGRVEFGVSYQEYIANSYVGGNTGLVAVAAILQHNTCGIMTRAEDGVTTARDLDGKRYATWEMPIEQATVRQVVERDGGDFSKVQLVPYTVEDDVAGLVTNMYDAVWVYEGWAVQSAALRGVDVNFFSFISIDDVFDYYTPVIAANTKYLEEHPEEARAFLRATKKGYEFAAEHPDEASAILCEAVPELDADLVLRSTEFLANQFVEEGTEWGVIDAQRWARFFAWLNDNGLVEEPIDESAGWTGDYL